MTTLSRGLAAVASVLALTTLAACSGASSGKGDVTTTITDTSPSTAPSTGPTDGPSPASPDPTADDQTAAPAPAEGDVTTYEVPRAGLSFALPADWTGLDAAALQEQLDQAGVSDDVAGRLGATPEQLQQLVASNVVFYATAPADGGFRGNLNVLLVEDQPLDLRAIEGQYEAIGATDIDSRDVSTAAGDGFATTYTLQAGSITVHGEAIVIGLDGQVAVITVSLGDAAATSALAQDLLDSLALT